MNTIKSVSEKTGLKPATVSKWAKIKKQPMIGKGMYICTDDFIEWLKTRKPRNRNN